MLSIRTQLVKAITIVIGLILFAIFLIVDLSVDDWVDNQFDQSLTSKANYLRAFLKEEDEHAKFNYNKDAMMLFDHHSDSDYFQIWQGDTEIARSHSLDVYPGTNLLKTEIPLNTSVIVPVTLPNGQDGKTVLTYYLPPAQTNENPDVIHQKNAIYISVAASTDSISGVLILIDISLILSFVAAILGVRILVTRIVDSGLKPLQDLNQNIKSLDISASHAHIPEPAVDYAEVTPIRKELNHFISTNCQLLANEKRLTADIAHELKTPISEMISLSEVYIRYPHDERIGASYKEDMLDIALRMKEIVNNLMLLQHSATGAFNIDCHPQPLLPLLDKVLGKLAFKYDDCRERVALHYDDEPTVYADLFSLDTILTNLLDNGLFYSPAASRVDITMAHREPDLLMLSIKNSLSSPLSEEDIEQLCKPLYQADPSRSQRDRHGLGLAIVDNLCRANHFEWNIRLLGHNRIEVAVLIPLVSDSEAILTAH